MPQRYRFVVVLLILVASGALVMVGEVDQDVDLSSVLEVWSDVLRDVDQFGFKLTRVSEQEEMQVGKKITSSIAPQWRENQEWVPYISAVGKTLLPHIRRQGIAYEFHVIKSSQVNAFALPGGQIFVMTGMLQFLQSEAELAAILGHEISHVDLRHCIERFQYELALKKVGAGGLGQLVEIGRRLLTAGYNKYQEFEADEQGVRLSIQAGYNPEAGAAVFNRLKLLAGERTRPEAKTPVGEVVQALDEAMGSYLRSHPASAERTRRLKSLIDRNREQLSGQDIYEGAENYRQRVPRIQQEFAGERHRF